MPLPCTGPFQFLFAVLLDFMLREFLFRPASSSRLGARQVKDDKERCT